MPIQNAMQGLAHEIPDCVAAGYLNLTTGELLGTRAADPRYHEVLHLLAEATQDLFHGQRVSSLEALFRSLGAGPPGDDPYFQEVVISSTDMIHILTRGRRTYNRVLITSCRSSANLGMVLTRTRRALTMVEAIEEGIFDEGPAGADVMQTLVRS